MPLPAATQSAMVQQAAARLNPAFARLAEQTAKETLLHNDDTTKHLLNFIQETRAKALPASASADRTRVFTRALFADRAHGPIAFSQDRAVSRQ